jgi:hypothetical protein
MTQAAAGLRFSNNSVFSAPRWRVERQRRALGRRNHRRHRPVFDRRGTSSSFATRDPLQCATRQRPRRHTSHRALEGSTIGPGWLGPRSAPAGALLGRWFSTIGRQGCWPTDTIGTAPATTIASEAPSRSNHVVLVEVTRLRLSLRPHDVLDPIIFIFSAAIDTCRSDNEQEREIRGAGEHRPAAANLPSPESDAIVIVRKRSAGRRRFTMIRPV